MGFSAYKFLTNRTIEQLMNDPDGARLSLRRRRSREGGSQMMIAFEEDDRDA